MRCIRYAQLPDMFTQKNEIPVTSSRQRPDAPVLTGSSTSGIWLEFSDGEQKKTKESLTAYLSMK